jgi:hypothetical protein
VTFAHGRVGQRDGTGSTGAFARSFYSGAMTDHIDHDATHGDFNGARFDRATFNDARLRRVNLSGAEFRGVRAEGTRFIGVEFIDVEMTGEFENVTFNGVDIAPLVEAELNRREPDRAKMRPTTVAGFQEAWQIVQRRWDTTLALAGSLPSEALHTSVDGEWSFVQTLRHLNFATAAWVGRMILGDPSPWHPLDLPWDEAPGWNDIPWDREATPSLDEVLAVRRARQAMVTGVIEALTDDQLASSVTRTEPGWPKITDFPFKECLLIVLNEEWEHRNFAERDLSKL